MPDEEGYRRLAQQCREQAALLRDEAAASWLRLAEGYEKLAEKFRAFRKRHPKTDDE